MIHILLSYCILCQKLAYCVQLWLALNWFFGNHPIPFSFVFGKVNIVIHSFICILANIIRHPDVWINISCNVSTWDWDRVIYASPTLSLAKYQIRDKYSFIINVPITMRLIITCHSTSKWWGLGPSQSTILSTKKI